MPKQPKDTTDSPKRGNYKLRKDRKKRKELAIKHSQDSDSDDDDSSSDYYPGDDVPEMDNRELQKFIQKIFPNYFTNLMAWIHWVMCYILPSSRM